MNDFKLSVLHHRKSVLQSPQKVFVLPGLQSRFPVLSFFRDELFSPSRGTKGSFDSPRKGVAIINVPLGIVVFFEILGQAHRAPSEPGNRIIR